MDEVVAYEMGRYADPNQPQDVRLEAQSDYIV
jgi:hypothetical protein